MMLFKTWGYITVTSALTFTSDFKLGHYMKVPPRSMFSCQVVATVIAGTAQLGVQAWLFSNVEGLCSPTQNDGFTCPRTTVFGTASIIVCYILSFPPYFVPIANVTLAVGCHWPTASLLARPALLRSFILLLAWGSPSGHPVDSAPEVQDRTPEIPQLSAHFLGHERDAACNADQPCALGRHLFLIQLCHPSPKLQLVGQVQL
jgi:hypothetical protein